MATAEPTATRATTSTRTSSPRPRVTSRATTVPAVAVTDEPLATLAPATAEPSPTPVAAVKKAAQADPVTRLIVYVVLGGVVLAGAGAGGLYLTRHPR